MIRASVAAALCFLVLASGAAAGGTGQRLYEEARRAYRRLESDGPEARDARAWRSAARAFRRVSEESPGSSRADDGLYMAGICLERARAVSAADGDLEAAVLAYRGLAEGYPGSNLADDALIRAGRLREAGGDPAGARAFYRRALTLGGDLSGLARRRLARAGQVTRIRGVRHWSGSGYTRVVLDLTGSTPHLPRTLPADPAAGRPPRIYLDLGPARMGSDCAPCAPVSDGLVRQVRAAQHDRRTVRVVLDLEAAATFRVFPLTTPDRLVIDVFRERQGAPDPVAALIREGPRRTRVVIDPGHGGRDPGALGPGGLREKDVTLSLARELRRVLRERTAWDVRLTRDRDVTLSLEERTAVANAFGADLFVSVHANASRSSRARGVETYYLDRASDRATRRLAARENASREAELAEIEHILADVLLTTKISESRRLAGEIQEALVTTLSSSYGPVRDLGVKRGPFYVLTGAAMPAVLVETSFITHPVESRRLADAGFRRTAAEAMARAVERFAGGG